MTETPQLTATDVRALRAANSFHVWIDGTRAEVSLTKRAPSVRAHDPFSPSTEERRYTFTCGIDSINTGSAGESYSPSTLKALALIVRPGDILKWAIRTNNNGYLEAAVIPAGALDYAPYGYSGLHRDELIVSVERPSKTGSRQLIRDLVMADSITPDNTARIRRHVAPRAVAS